MLLFVSIVRLSRKGGEQTRRGLSGIDKAGRTSRTFLPVEEPFSRPRNEELNRRSFAGGGRRKRERTRFFLRLFISRENGFRLRRRIGGSGDGTRSRGGRNEEGTSTGDKWLITVTDYKSARRLTSHLSCCPGFPISRTAICLLSSANNVLEDCEKR